MPDSADPRPVLSPTGFLAGINRWDLLILPLISLLTVLSMLGTSEVAARKAWPEQVNSCQSQEAEGFTYRANCRSQTKLPEGPWVDNSYNECGYRTAEPCAPPKPGVIRVATIGSSISFGYEVPYEQAFPALTSAALSRQCGKPVEFQNTGKPLRNFLATYWHLDEALALKPDLIVFAVDPYDAQVNEMRPELEASLDQPYVPPVGKKAAEVGVLRRWTVLLKQSRAVEMLQHQLYTDPATYLKLYLLYGDASAGFLKRDPSPTWQGNYRNLELLIAAMARKTSAQHVPLLILTTPAVSQVALLHRPAEDGLDPEAFAKHVEAIAVAHGAHFVDSLPAMAGSDDPMGLFYLVDGHAGPKGQARIAKALETALISGDHPLIAGCKN
jgi:hypothetical protein